MIFFIDESLLVIVFVWLGYDKWIRKEFVDSVHMMLIYGSSLSDTLETSVIDCRMVYKNLFVIGDYLYGGFGFEGVFFGSLMVL